MFTTAPKNHSGEPNKKEQNFVDCMLVAPLISIATHFDVNLTEVKPPALSIFCHNKTVF